ncbi:MAG TPA: methylated-DNA--[protein]-cysteine S-methyltransferase [Bauldia sp.]|nr:methylated-DNA--[protein]-cysteine S-methyltransferase [Bauldia sp.]
MDEKGIAYFDTTIGRCGIAWGPGGIVGIQLPAVDDEQMRVRMAQRFAGLPEADWPVKVGRAAAAITALLAGQPSDLWPIVLDMDGIPYFERRVYTIARTIPRGRTSTYGAIAAEIGDASLARSVGNALGRNPFAIVVPCHRVLGSGGKPGGFSASGGVITKLRLLNIERARTSEVPMLFDELPLATAPRRARG